MSIESARNPKRGDKWVERGHVDICTVRSVCDKHVTVKWHTATRRDATMSRKDFAKFISYETIPNKTWCDCTPRKLRRAAW